MTSELISNNSNILESSGNSTVICATESTAATVRIIGAKPLTNSDSETDSESDDDQKVSQSGSYKDGDLIIAKEVIGSIRSDQYGKQRNNVARYQRKSLTASPISQESTVSSNELATVPITTHDVGLDQQTLSANDSITIQDKVDNKINSPSTKDQSIPNQIEIAGQLNDVISDNKALTTQQREQLNSELSSDIEELIQQKQLMNAEPTNENIDENTNVPDSLTTANESIILIKESETSSINSENLTNYKTVFVESFDEPNVDDSRKDMKPPKVNEKAVDIIQENSETIAERVQSTNRYKSHISHIVETSNNSETKNTESETTENIGIVENVPSSNGLSDGLVEPESCTPSNKYIEESIVENGDVLNTDNSMTEHEIAKSVDSVKSSKHDTTIENSNDSLSDHDEGKEKIKAKTSRKVSYQQQFSNEKTRKKSAQILRPRENSIEYDEPFFSERQRHDSDDSLKNIDTEKSRLNDNEDGSSIDESGLTEREKHVIKHRRFNPFDREVIFNEEHFSTAKEEEEYFSEVKEEEREGLLKLTEENKSKSSSGGSSFTTLSVTEIDTDVSYAELGLAEDYFCRPEGHFGMTGIEELEMAIENCKELIKETPQESEKRKNLVRKLIHLRLKVQELKEGDIPEEPDIRSVVGHKFRKRDSRSSRHYCEKCNGLIWGVLQFWFRCQGRRPVSKKEAGGRLKHCGYCSHEKCLNLITRTCANVKVRENPTYILSICPEKGLASQGYRCAECRLPISHVGRGREPRLCDYTGNYYCDLCHWNDSMVIPARVTHNWDFEQRKVCRASKQLLRLMYDKSVLRIQDINPMLFNFVDELHRVKKLREEFLIMKKYFLCCKKALEEKLLLQLKARQHFVENSDMYSLKDLTDINSETLLPELDIVHASFIQHITRNCQLCHLKGFICEICKSSEILFPFDDISIVCSQCSYVLHRNCFVKGGNHCPRCDRRERRGDTLT